MSTKKDNMQNKNPLQDAVNSSLFFRMNLRLMRFALVAGVVGALVMGGLLRLFSVG